MVGEGCEPAIYEFLGVMELLVKSSSRCCFSLPI